MREGSWGLCSTVGAQGTQARSQAGVGLLDHLHAQLLGGEGADSRCFPGTKPPGAPLGAVTAAQPPSCCQALCPELVIAGAGQHSPTPSLSLSTPLHPLPSSQQPPGAAPSCQGPCFFPPASFFPPQLLSVSSSRVCAHHTKQILQNCQHRQVTTPQGPQPKA